MKPTLWRVPAYSRPGLPSPTISQSTAPPPPPNGRRSGRYSSPEESSAPSASCAWPRLADELRLGLDFLGGFALQPRRGERRDDGLLEVVEQRDALGRRERGEQDRLADLHLADVVHDRLRDRRRQRLDVQLARDLLEHAAFLDARRVVDAGQLERHDRVDRLVEVHAQQVDVDGLAAHGVALGLLEHDRRRFLAVDAEVEHGARAREREAQLARVGVEADRLAAAAVEHAGHAAAAAQAARRARARRVAAVDVELGGRVGHEATADC